MGTMDERAGGAAEENMEQGEALNIIRAHAWLIHQTLRDYGVYSKPVSESEFWERAESYLYERARDVAQGRSKLTQVLVWLSYQPASYLQEVIPIQEYELRSTLQQHVLGFHQVLAGAGVYQTPIGKAGFVSRTSNKVSNWAQRMAKGDCGLIGGVLLLPGSLLFNLSDVVRTLRWDFEFGYRPLLENLRELLERASLSFDWEFDPQQATLSFSISSQTWVITDLDIDDHVEPEQYNCIHQALSDYLKQHELCLYDEALTGDQTGLIVLMPLKAVNEISRYLISESDPKVKLLYPTLYYGV
jgi:hypothetical protein